MWICARRRVNLVSLERLESPVKKFKDRQRRNFLEKQVNAHKEMYEEFYTTFKNYAASSKGANSSIQDDNKKNSHNDVQRRFIFGWSYSSTKRMSIVLTWLPWITRFLNWKMCYSVQALILINGTMEAVDWLASQEKILFVKSPLRYVDEWNFFNSNFFCSSDNKVN